jgi:hypothetical protein
MKKAIDKIVTELDGNICINKMKKVSMFKQNILSLCNANDNFYYCIRFKSYFNWINVLL